MTADERAKLVLAFAGVLFVNGQATEQTVRAAERLGRALALRARVTPRWGELLLVADDKDRVLISQVAAIPAGVEMDRVAATMRAIDDIASGRLAPDAATKTIAEISGSSAAPTLLFTFAAAAGAMALAVIFGVQHIAAAALIGASAGAGAMLRRAVSRVSTNLFLQPFCAAALAGVIGALAVRYDLSSSLRLVAVCPCMVLVPGPHLLNAAFDLIDGRIALGAARLAYAGLIVAAIAVGLLAGLALLGVSLPADPIGRSIPLWQDVIAAGVAVAAYSVFFQPRFACWRGRSPSAWALTLCDGRRSASWVLARRAELWSLASPSRLSSRLSPGESTCHLPPSVSPRWCRWCPASISSEWPAASCRLRAARRRQWRCWGRRPPMA
jgi:uncharacterized membrane protein YjjP (DUF1212 family)